MSFAMVAAGGLAAAGAIGGSLIASDATNKAANTQANAANQATQAQLQMFNTTQGNLNPYIQAGTNTLPAFMSYLGVGQDGSFNPNAPGVMPYTQAHPYQGPDPTQFNYQSSPGYQFALQQGQQGINNAATRNQGVNSGNTLKALSQYTTGMANQDYNSQFQNYLAGISNYQQNYYNQGQLYNVGQANTAQRLGSIVGSGQNAAAGLGTIANSVGGQIGNNMMAAGNSISAGQMTQGQIYGNLLTQLTAGTQSKPSLLSQLFNMGGGGGGQPQTVQSPYGDGLVLAG